MNCWTILAIERTADTSIIKKAYKQQLLKYHPEDDPDGYQRVRAAYKAAMNEAKKQAEFDAAQAQEEMGEHAEHNTDAEEEGIHVTRKHFASRQDDESYEEENIRVTHRQFALEYDDSNNEEDIVVSRRHFATHYDDGNNEDEEIEVPRRYFATEDFEKQQIRHDFMSSLVNLYGDLHQRNDPDAWISVLNHRILWDVQQKSIIDEELLQFFSANHNLNENIWVIIENYTGLFAKLDRNSEQYSAYFVDKYILSTQKAVVPRNWKDYSNLTVVERLRVSWLNYCYGYLTPFSWIIMFVVFNAFSIVILFLIAIIRSILFIRRRTWKIVMWEYHLSYINSWGKRYDFKYIDIIKVNYSPLITDIYFKNKKITIHNGEVHYLRTLLDKISKYGIWYGNTLIVQENAQN